MHDNTERRQGCGLAPSCSQDCMTGVAAYVRKGDLAVAPSRMETEQLSDDVVMLRSRLRIWVARTLQVAMALLLPQAAER